MRGSLVPATGERPKVVLGTVGPMPVRDWAGEAAGSSKVTVSTTVHRRRPRRKRGGDGSYGLRVMGRGGRHAHPVLRCNDIWTLALYL